MVNDTLVITPSGELCFPCACERDRRRDGACRGTRGWVGNARSGWIRRASDEEFERAGPRAEARSRDLDASEFAMWTGEGGSGYED